MLDQRDRAGNALAHHRPAGDLDQGKQRHRRQERDRESVFDLVGPAVLFRFFHEKLLARRLGVLTKLVAQPLHFIEKIGRCVVTLPPKTSPS